ncbi:hypothetical protein [Streptomyces sp. AK08-02]|uniref:hypothetical protein n=1 Tax=Streptomyces sp. AK08-02 TaxID=3028654 RepID=UPI0029BB44FD|nr:hypothetical protein [Streptomyces sp. AK08-02]MDX3752806.1 hypothetical protein [Streptomyces sp. AK08-02]
MPEPTPEEALAAYGSFVQQCQNLTDSHRNDPPSAAHVHSAQELLKSAVALIDVLDRLPATVQTQPLPKSWEVATALQLAVPTLLVHSGYVTPPMPALPVLLGQLTGAALDISAGVAEGRLRDAEQALTEINQYITSAQHTVSDTDTDADRHSFVRGVLRVSRRLLPFVTTATVVACAPLLLPVAGGITAALFSVGTSVAGILLPSKDELHDAFHEQPGSLTVPQAELLTEAADIALTEAEMCLRIRDGASRRAWALRAYEVAMHHVDALPNTGDPAPSETVQRLTDRAARIRATLDALPPPGTRSPAISTRRRPRVRYSLQTNGAGTQSSEPQPPPPSTPTTQSPSIKDPGTQQIPRSNGPVGL